MTNQRIDALDLAYHHASNGEFDASLAFATIALAESASTANLIAYLPHATVNGREDSQRGIVRELIEERLGLK
jgi:hypothetical protein